MARVENGTKNNHYFNFNAADCKPNSPVGDKALPMAKTAGEEKIRTAPIFSIATAEQSTPKRRRAFPIDSTATPQTFRRTETVDATPSVNSDWKTSEKSSVSMKSRPILLTPTRKHSLAGDEITPNTQRAVRTYFQRHHIIPKFIWKDDNFSSNLKELGFKRDDRINMVTLPMVRFIPEKISAYATPSSAKTFGERSAHSSLHGGAHGTAYISHIKKGLEQIFDGNLPKNKKKRQLLEFLSKTRNELLSGFLRLNSL